MVNPGMFGVSKEQMEMARQIGDHLRIEITKYRKEGRFEVKLMPLHPDQNFNSAEMVDGLCHQFAYLFNTLMNVKGKIINVD
jgi:hypothetical protein